MYNRADWRRIARWANSLMIMTLILHLLFIMYIKNIKPEKLNFVLVGTLQNIHYIETYDDLRNFSSLYNGSGILRDVNILITSGIIFDDLFKQKEKFAVVSRSNNSTFHMSGGCDDHIFPSYAVTKYVLDDKNYVWTGVGKQSIENLNNGSSLQKDDIKSYILFEVEDLRDFRSNLNFIDPAHHYMKAIRLDSTKTTFYNIRYHVHIYGPVKTNEVSCSKNFSIPNKIKSITPGYHWIFAVGQTKMTDWNKKSVDNLCKRILGKNIYISYVKV